MNRIYKVIWSKVRNCYVVVSEIAKRHSKSAVNSGFSVTRNILAGTVLLGLTAGICAPVWAADGKVGSYNFIGDKLYIDNSSATGERAVAFGYDTVASGAKSFAMGHGSQAKKDFSVAFGYETIADGPRSFVTGFKSRALGEDSSAWGYQTVASGSTATSKGKQTIAVGNGATTWGYQTIVGKIADNYTVDYENPDLTKITAAENATAWGGNTNAAAMDAAAWGWKTTASGTTSTAFGISTLASGDQSTAFGQGTIASGIEATAFGLYTYASGKHSIAAGEGATKKVNGEDVFDEENGGYTEASGDDSVALGYAVKAAGDHSIAVGWKSKTAEGASESVAMGKLSEANDDYAVAAGFHAVANGTAAVALGYNSTATGEASFAVGKEAKATKYGAVALGSYSVTTNEYDSKGGYAISGKTPGSAKPGNDTKITENYVWAPAGGYGNVAVGDVSGETKITRRITGLAAGYDLTDAVNVAQLYDLRDQISSSSSDWQLADADGVVDGKTPYTVNTVDGKPQVTLKVVNNKDENPAAKAQNYVIDLSGLPDNDTTYTGEQTVTAASGTEKGSTTFELKEAGTEDPVGSMTLKAGDNVTITEDGGTAVINATDTKYTAGSGININENNEISSTASLKFAGDDAKDDATKVITKANGEQLDIVGGASDKASQDNIYTENKDGQIHINLAKDIEGVDNITVNNTVTTNTLNTETINLGPTDNSTSITYNKEGDRISYGDNIIATLGDGMNYGGDFNKPEGGKRVSVALDKNVDVKGNAASEEDLVDGNIGVVAEAVGEDAKLTVKLNKDIDLGEEGSVTIGDTNITNNNVTVGDTVITDNSVTTSTVNTQSIKLGDTTNNTSITYDGDRISYTKGGDTYNVANTADVVWNAHVKNAAGTQDAGTVNIANPDFTFVEGANVTITPDKDNNQITISAKTDLSGVSLKFAGDDAKDDATKVITKANGEQLDIVGGASDKASQDNIYTENKDGQIHINLAKDIEGVDNITVNNTVTTNTLNTETINLGPTDNSTSITYNKEGDRISYGDNIIATLGDGMNYGGDFNKPEGGKRVSVALDKNVDVKGNAASEEDLVDGNIGVVAEAVGEDAKLTVKLNKDIDLGEEGSVTIGDTNITNNNVTVGDTVITDNSVTTSTVNTQSIKLGDTTNNTSITYDGDRISYTKGGDTYNVANTADIGWNAYVGSVDEKNKAGTVDINNKNFTFIAGDNVTIDKGSNAITINSASFEAGDGITISKDATTNKYKISLNVEGGVTPTDTVTVEPKSSTGSETAGGEATTPGTTGGETAGSGTSGAAEAGKTVTITSDTNSTAFTDDKGTTFVTVTPTSIDDKTSAANNLQIKGDGTNISTVATSNGQDKGGSIEVKLKDDITVENVTVNETVNVGGNTTITGDTITTKNIEGDTITGDTINATTVNGDTINATTVNGDTINTKTINLGDNITIQEGDDNRITYKSGDTTYNIATTEDGMDFAGDDGKAIHKDLTEQLDVVGGAKDKASEYNIYTYNDGDKLRINLAKDINGVDSVTVNNTINVGGNTTITGDTITTNTFKAGDTTINNDGLTINEGPSITKNKVDVAGNKIINVAPGEDGTDAVNVDQLNNAMNQAGDVINRMGDQISRVDSRMRKGLAGAAALAALHPMDFDPDDKLTFAAGVGNYRGENAAAVGAFYRPDEKVMFSIGGTMGNGENMVNAGISFSLDRVAHVTNSKTAMAREILDLRKEVTELKASLASGNWMLDPTLTRLFPDTAENHWAYEYVKTLAGNHIIEGYPDGEFKGDRMITRYEMAAILYRAMMNGAQLPDKALNEFAAELGRFRVDRVYGNGDDRHKVERIRVNDENRKERDAYGSQYEYFRKHPGANVSTGALPGTKQAEKAAKVEAEAQKADKPSIVSEKAAS